MIISIYGEKAFDKIQNAFWASLVAQLVKNLWAMQETLAWFLGQEDPTEKIEATHSSILRLPWCLWWLKKKKKKKILLQGGRPGFDLWVGKIPWRREWQPTPVFLPEETPWTEEPDGLQSMGSLRVGHDWVTTHTAKADEWVNNFSYIQMVE